MELTITVMLFQSGAQIIKAFGDCFYDGLNVRADVPASHFTASIISKDNLLSRALGWRADMLSMLFKFLGTETAHLNQ